MKLQVFESNLSASPNPELDKLLILKNARSFIKGQLSFIKRLLAREQSGRTIERSSNEVKINRPIKWTKSKTDLVELAYATIANETFNNGDIDIKELLTFLADAFEVPLGNFYDTYVQIRRRKGSRTVFLDELIKKFQAKMENSDSKFTDRSR